jgi:hypothetical protein
MYLFIYLLLKPFTLPLANVRQRYETTQKNKDFILCSFLLTCKGRVCFYDIVHPWKLCHELDCSPSTHIAVNHGDGRGHRTQSFKERAKNIGFNHVYIRIINDSKHCIVL